MNTQAEVIETEVDGQGSLSAGFLFASFKNVGENPITVAGVPLAPGEAKGYPFVGKAYNHIEYNAEGSILRILQVI